ncbi:MAG: hypothetical protein HOE54_16945, partial [Gammaproteobacteria bacterium]|nr:hypothetical protein [Gammaproteobacteria bacterium]
AYSFTAKLSGSLGGSIGLFGLAFIGFNSVTPELNTPVQLFGLKFLFAVVPSIFFLGACAIIWRYPITEERHVEMRRELEAQNRSVALGSDIDS